MSEEHDGIPDLSPSLPMFPAPIHINLSCRVCSANISMLSRPRTFITHTPSPEIPCVVETSILAEHDVNMLFDQMKYRGMASIPRHLQFNDDDHHGEGDGLVSASLQTFRS